MLVRQRGCLFFFLLPNLLSLAVLSLQSCTVVPPPIMKSRAPVVPVKKKRMVRVSLVRM